MLGQEREHAARRNQVPDHLGGVPQLPLRPLHTLHKKIIPGERTQAHRHTAHPTGFFSAVLGAHAAARALDEDTLARRREVLGDDHPSTMESASNLAVNLYQLGKHERARDLHEDTLARRREVLGDDHPDTLSSARWLVADLRALDEDAEAGRWQAWIDARNHQ
jgi:hypothetical protein